MKTSEGRSREGLGERYGERALTVDPNPIEMVAAVLSAALIGGWFLPVDAGEKVRSGLLPVVPRTGGGAG